MDLIRYLKPTAFAGRWHYCNVFQYYPRGTMNLLLKHTFAGEINFDDTDRKEITYLVQKGLTPYQATVTHCWTEAKYDWDFGEDCEFNCGYGCGCPWSGCTCDREFMCKCRCQCDDGCICEETILNRICDGIKRGLEDNCTLTNLLVVLHNGEDNLVFTPVDISDWQSRRHGRYEPPPPRTMQTLFDISKDVVLREFDRSEVTGVLPDMMVNTLFGCKPVVPKGMTASYLSKQTVVALKQMARERKMRGFSTMRKAALVELLTGVE